jgi:hypothetical protein
MNVTSPLRAAPIRTGTVRARPVPARTGQIRSLWARTVRVRTGRLAPRTATGILAASLLLAFTPRPDAALAASPQPAPLWLVKSNDLILLQHQAAEDGVTLPGFTWVGCGGKSDRDRCRPGQQPIFTSYWALRARAAAGWAGTAIFDIEIWPDTPALQHDDPDKWICRAAHLTRLDSRLKLIITPYFKPPKRRLIAEDVTAARCGSYGVDVQTQFLNGSPGQFGRFIRKAVRAIRRVNRKIVILAGLATNNPDVQRPAHLTTDYHEALAAGVQGFWLNARNWGRRNNCRGAQGGPGCPQVGIKFLEDIGLAGGA